jgi:hypothetical protein
MENVGLTHGWYSILLTFAYFMLIWYSLWSYGVFFPLWVVVPKTIWQPRCLTFWILMSQLAGFGAKKLLIPLEIAEQKPTIYIPNAKHGILFPRHSFTIFFISSRPPHPPALKVCANEILTFFNFLSLPLSLLPDTPNSSLPPLTAYN